MTTYRASVVIWQIVCPSTRVPVICQIVCPSTSVQAIWQNCLSVDKRSSDLAEFGRLSVRRRGRFLLPISIFPPPIEFDLTMPAAAAGRRRLITSGGLRLSLS